MYLGLFSFAAATLLLAASPLWPATEATSLPPTRRLEVPVRDFSQVAKETIPSIVSVKVYSQRPQWNEEAEEEAEQRNPFGNDPFFDRFFFGHPFFRNRGQPPAPPPSDKSRKGGAQGSGFIVGEEGYILTNNHVVKEAGEIIITLNDGREFSATIVGQDPNTDVALLKIDAKGLPPLTLGDSDTLEVGQWAIAIGNPLGLQASVTVGVISAKGRNNLDLARIEDFIQTDAAINRGNSGGPLLDIDGKVIGINTAIVTSMTGGGCMGIGFAIPSNMVRHIMEQLLSDGGVTRGYLGVSMQPVDHDLAQAFGLERVEGALITEVLAGSPAEKAGVRQGDVILKIDSLPVANIASLRNSVAMMKPGRQALLVVVRDGSPIELPIEIGFYPAASATTTQANAKFGFEVEAVTPELAKRHGYSEGEGVAIARVLPGTPADWAGLRKGALLLAINNKPIRSIEDYNRLIGNLQTDGKAPILFLIRQDGAVRYLSLRLK